MKFTREQFIQELRETVEFFESHPEVFDAEGNIDGFMCIFVDVREDALSRMAAFAKAAGHVSKRADEWNYSVVSERADNNIQIHMRAPRKEVCERIVTQKVIPAKHFDATEAFDLPERVEEVVTYSCPPSLLGMAKAAEVEA